MKKLREILEGEVIDFAAKRKSYHKPPENPNPDIMTRRDIQQKLDVIHKVNMNKWDDSRIKPKAEYIDGATVQDHEHSIEALARHAMNAEHLYNNNTNGINLFNKRKQIARDIYHSDRNEIDKHVSDTLRNLEALHNQVTNAKFPSEKEKEYSTLDIKRHITSWQLVKNRLNDLIKPND